MSSTLLTASCKNKSDAQLPVDVDAGSSVAQHSLSVLTALCDITSHHRHHQGLNFGYDARQQLHVVPSVLTHFFGKQTKRFKQSAGLLLSPVNTHKERNLSR